MAEELTITTFGGLRIALNQRPVAGFASRKAEALLIFLACTRRPHSREALGDLLWDERSSARARGNLTVVLASLRKELGAYIAADRQSIWLDPAAPLWLDVAELEAATAPLQRQPSPAALGAEQQAHLTQALANYRGDFLAGYSLRDCAGFEGWVLAEQQRLSQLAVLGHQALLGAARAQAADQVALAHAQALVQLEPYDEAAHRQVLELLAATGQRRAALTHYEQLRQTLADELGLEPDPQTSALYQRIRQGELEPKSAGPRRVAEARPAPQLSNAPAEPLPFVGRESELAQVTQRLSDPACRLLTILGPGGIGKTRFALQAAHYHSATRSAGAAFVSLAAIADPAQIAAAIAAALGMWLGPYSDPLDQVAAHLAERDLLLLIDNCEHLLDGMQALNYLLERASRLSILATSRERLRLRAEHVFELHGMPVPDQGAPTGVQASAVRLFAQHAEQLSNRFKLDDETLPAVLTICRLVEGMPLAIELAAGRIRSATCAQIAEQIAQNLDALASDLRDVAPRHRSARAVFDYSWRLLSEAERGALMRLAVFAGGCTTAAAQAVGAISAELLAALAEKSLVRMAGDQRYDLHELLRQFALEQLMQAPAAQNAWAQHARYYLRLIQDSAGALVGSAPQHTIAALHPERDNLRQAWLRAIELELFESLEAASVGMARWYAHTGNLREGVLAFDAALLPLSSQATPALRALATQLLGEQSELYNRQGMYEESRQYAERALQAAEQLGRGELIALACYRYGEALSGIGAYGEVGPYLERALALARQAGLAEWEPVILRHLGILAINQGAIEQSRQHYKEALAGFRALGNLRGEADVLNNLGVLLAERGDVARARPYYEQSIELQRAIGNLIGEASVLNNLANLGMSMGRYEEICRLFERALALHRSISDQQGEAIVLLNLGDTYRMVGDQPRAEALLSQALAIWQANSNLIDQAIANTALSQLSLDRRDHLAALAHIEEALRITRWLDAPPQHAETLTVAGRVYLQTERYDQAIAALQTAIAEREQAAQTDWALEAYSVLAQVLARSGQTEQAIGIMTERLLPRLRAGAPHINEPLAVYWACFEVLQATADPRAAWVLSQASALLGDWAAQISDPELRASFLAQPTNRAIQSAHAAGD